MKHEPALFCEVHFHPVNHPPPNPQETELTMNQLRRELLDAKTKTEENKALWDIAVFAGVLSNLEDEERERMREIIKRFS